MGHRGDQRSRRPGSRAAWSPTTRAATWCRTCPRPSTSCGCAAMVSSTPRRSMPSPASSSISPPCPPPTRPRRRSTIRRSTGTRCSKIPGADQFGGKSDIPAKVRQFDWLNLMKNNGCVGCHQLGQAATRTIPKAFGDFKTGEDAWIRRTQSGQAGELMVNILAGQLGGAPYKYFGDWTDRIAKGELPFAKPNRPSGVERNVVVTTWDWSDEKHYLHDLAVSDKRNPTVNGYGPVFGQPEYSTDRIPILNPVANSVEIFKAPVRDVNMPESLGPGHAAMLKPLQPSAYWGDEQIWDTRINNHNSMIDGKGRMWLAAAVRGVRQSGVLPEGLRPSRGQGVPARGKPSPARGARSQDDEIHLRRHLLHDPPPELRQGRQRHAVDLERRRHRGGRLVQHQAVRRDRRCGEGAGLDAAHPRHQRQRQARRLCRAQPAGRSHQGQAHRPGVLCGDGEPGRRLGVGNLAFEPGLDRAASSPAPIRSTRRSPKSTISRCRASARAAATSTARAWCGCRSPAATSAASTARKCKGPLNGPNATGNHCPEGWSFYQYPGPGFDGIGENSAEVELLLLGRPAQHVRPRRGRAGVDGEPQ